MSFKVACLALLTFLASIALASEISSQDDMAIPLLINAQKELHAVKMLTKEMVGSQKEGLILEQGILNKVGDILSQEQLHAAALNDSLSAIHLDLSNLERNALLVNGLLGLLMAILILRYSSIKMPWPLNGFLLQKKKVVARPSEIASEIMETLSAAQTVFTQDNFDTSVASALDATDPPAPSIVSVKVEKAVPFFGEDAQSQAKLQPLEIDSISRQLSNILVQVGEIRQAGMEKIHTSLNQKIASPSPVHLAMRQPRPQGNGYSSSKETIIRSKILSLRDRSR